MGREGRGGRGQGEGKDERKDVEGGREGGREGGGVMGGRERKIEMEREEAREPCLFLTESHAAQRRLTSLTRIAFTTIICNIICMMIRCVIMVLCIIVIIKLRRTSAFMMKQHFLRCRMIATMRVHVLTTTPTQEFQEL